MSLRHRLWLGFALALGNYAIDVLSNPSPGFVGVIASPEHWRFGSVSLAMRV